MSRNSSGLYSLPLPAYVPLTAIVATDMNTNLNDIANTLTLSLPLDGSAPMTGPIKGANGSASAPSYAFNNSLGTGFYLNTSESGFSIVVASVSVVIFTSASASTTAPYAAYWWYPNAFHGSVAFNGGVAFSNGINATTTITGNLTITGGLIVGFNSAPVSDQINIGDANFYWNNDTLVPTLNFDTNDIFRYNRASNRYEFIINNVTTHTIESASAFYSNYLTIPEITAPSSAPTSNVYIYAKDNSGTTRLYYKDSQGVETPMGGPGSWEEITSFAVTTSVASIVFSLSKIYSRIAICGVSISGTATGTKQLIVEVSDDSGGSYETAYQGGFGGDADPGGVIGEKTLVSSPMRDYALSASTADLAFWIEFFMCDVLATPKPFSGQAAIYTEVAGFYGTGQTTSCDEVDAIRIRWGSGELIDSGTITLYGELTI